MYQRDGQIGSWWVPAMIVGAVAFAALAWGSAPGLLWYDTGEFGAVAWRLSLSHPPGHPAHTMWTHAAQFVLPFGDGIFRANLSSAVAVSFALACLYCLLKRAKPDAPTPLIILAALTPLAIPCIYDQSIRSEVYGLQLALSMLMTYMALRFHQTKDQRIWLIMAFCFGVAGANHSYIAVTLLCLPIASLIAGDCSLRSIGAGIVAGALGLCLYLYLPLRALSGGLVGWGQPDSLTRFVGTVSGQDWSRNLVPDATTDSIWPRLSALAGYIDDQLGWMFLVGLVLSIVWLIRSKQLRGPVFVLLLAMVLPFILRLGNDFDSQNPDMGGYLAWGMVVPIIVLLYAIPFHRHRLFAWLTAVLLLSVWASWFEHERFVIPEDRAAERYAQALLDGTVADGVLLTGDYSTTFSIWALLSVFGERPDVSALFRGQMDQTWSRARLRRIHPEMADRLNRAPSDWVRSDVSWELGVRMESLGELRAQLFPTALSAGIGRRWSSLEDHAQQFRVFDGASFAGLRFKALLHLHFIDQLIATRGPAEWVHWHLKAARTLAPNDPMLNAFDRRVRNYAAGVEPKSL
ncbi:MAG: protein O-mannosyl-transferase family [Bradymonadia bacterium]